MFGFLKSHRRTQDGPDEEDDWPSIVLLLREAVLPSAEEAIEMAGTAWGAAGQVELLGAVGPHNFVIRVAPLTFALHAVGSRYEAETGQLNAMQKQCWDQHSAWLSVDLPGRQVGVLRQSGQLAGAYKSLMYFVLRHWSQNCSALYFPSEQATLPNYGDLIDSIRSARRDGINLDFLKENKAQLKGQVH
jgi:hypothetical protein